MKGQNKDRQRPLQAGETLDVTIGCRHSRPEVCKNNMTEKQCAFVRSDNSCLLPPRSWKELFEKLKLEAD